MESMRVLWCWLCCNKEQLQAIGAIATSVALFSTLYFGLKSLFITNKNIGLTHNATIFISDVSIDGALDNETPIKITMKNSGNTKAVDVSFAFQILNLSSKPEDVKNGEWSTNSGLIFYPHQERHILLELPVDHTNHKFLCGYFSYKPIVGTQQHEFSFFQIETKVLRAYEITLNQKVIRDFKPYLDNWKIMARKEMMRRYQ